jgi:hypothetical protein
MQDYGNMVRQLMDKAKPVGETVTRTVPNTGTVLQYDVLEKHDNGDITVRIIPPAGYPQMPPFRAPGSKFK